MLRCLAWLCPQHPDVKLCYRKLFLGRGQHCHVGFNDARLGSEVCTLKVSEGSDVCWSCCEGTMTSSLELQCEMRSVLTSCVLTPGVTCMSSTGTVSGSSGLGAVLAAHGRGKGHADEHLRGPAAAPQWAQARQGRAGGTCCCCSRESGPVTPSSLHSHARHSQLAIGFAAMPAF